MGLEFKLIFYFFFFQSLISQSILTTAEGFMSNFEVFPREDSKEWYLIEGKL